MDETLELSGELRLVHDSENDKFDIEPIGSRPLNSFEDFRVYCGQKYRSISGSELLTYIDIRHEEIYDAFYDDKSDKQRRARINGILIESHKETKRRDMLHNETSSEWRKRMAIQRRDNPVKDGPWIHEAVRRWMKEVVHPGSAYVDLKPERKIAHAITYKTNYVTRAINEFLNHPKWRNAFLWIYKHRVLADGYTDNIYYKPNPSVVLYTDNIGLSTIRQDLRWQIMNIIESCALAPAGRTRRDQKSFLRFYLQGGKLPEDSRLITINTPSIKWKYDNLMGQGRWAKRAKKSKRLPKLSLSEFGDAWKWTMELLPSAEKPKRRVPFVSELLCKDEEAAIQTAIREDLKVYDPQYRQHKLEDLRSRLWQMIAYSREGATIDELKKAVGYSSIEDLMVEFKKVWASNESSFVNRLFFHSSRTDGASYMFSRLDALWSSKKLNLLGKFLKLEDTLYPYCFHCPKCEEVFIPPKDQSGNVCCPACQYKAERRAFKWKSARPEFNTAYNHDIGVVDPADFMEGNVVRTSHANGVKGGHFETGGVWRQPNVQFSSPWEVSAFNKWKEDIENYASEAELELRKKQEEECRKTMVETLTVPFEERNSTVKKRVVKRNGSSSK